MAKILYQGTCGPESPTRAVFPFDLAGAAVDAGIEAEIFLLGEAVLLMKDVLANSVLPVGAAPLKNLLATVVEKKVPIYV